MLTTMNVNATRWVAEGKQLGATHVLDVYNTFHKEHYPIYVMPNENLQKIQQLHSIGMHQIHATYPIPTKEQ